MPDTRSAALQVAHHRDCEHATKSSLESLDGCTCKSLSASMPVRWPRFYTLHRDSTGVKVRGDRTSNRREAERELTKLLGDIYSGDLPEARARMTFREWAGKYLDEVLPVGNRKGSTIRAYRPTIKLANDVFGSRYLDAIGADDLRKLVANARANDASDATVSKHLRHLGAILEAATNETPPLLKFNPVPKFKKGLRLRVASGTEPYTDLELAKLWAAMAKLEHKDTERDGAEVYVAIAKAAVLTGARLGELIALNWDDLNLSAGTLEIRHTWNREDGLTLPKDGEPRTVHLLPQARTLFEEWTANVGVKAGDRPVFTAPRSGERLNGQYVARVVDKARRNAGIPDVGEGGRKRKPVHAFRATYATMLIEQGLNPKFVQDELGHASSELTDRVYTQWSEKARHAEAAKAERLPV
jgi:integrase